MSLREEPEQIDRDYVRLLMMMRRFVRDEFDVRVAISDTAAAQTLLDYASRSRNKVLQEMGSELSEILAPSPASSIEHASLQDEKGHFYRGVLQQPKAPKSPSPEEGEAALSGSCKRIYRGRVINS